ncbi:MAG: MFS transporter [Pseudonocardiaceae bacterium]|nr:MFS transporter [Pseudonocardiaceae bacterium]
MNRRRYVFASVASVAGFAFDLFDLFILLYLASTLGPLFFPSASPTLSLAAVYASFAVSLLMRPAGSVVFGPLNDRFGRRRMMRLTVLGVGVSTALMGAVPTYEASGLFGPLIFILLRLVQGLFVGGVVASTHTLATETVPERWRGLVSGLITGGGAGVGAVLASLTFLILSYVFPGDSFDAWGWRVMFFTGLLGAGISFLILHKVEESPMWQEQIAKKGAKPAPVRLLFRAPHLRITLASVLVGSALGASYYLTSGYLPTFFAEINELPGSSAGRLLIWVNLIVVPATLLTGHLSQSIGRRRVFLIFGGANIVMLPLLYWLMAGRGPGDELQILLLGLVLAFFGNAVYGPALVYFNERYPTEMRATGTAICWNFGFAIGGTMTTFVSLTSPTIADIPSRLMVFLAVWSVVLVVAVVLSRETRGTLADRSVERT